MKTEFDPGRLDVKAFAASAATLSGHEALTAFSRLAGEIRGETAAVMVAWQARGEIQTPLGGAPEIRLHLSAHVDMPLICQRCMGPVVVAVDVDRPFRFVADEATAELLDEESEEDVLVISREFDLLALVEDELLMALPLVPRHDICPVPVRHEAKDAAFDAVVDPNANPFAVLAGLKRVKGE